MGKNFLAILIGVVVVGLMVGAAFGAGVAYGRATAPKATTASAPAIATIGSSAQPTPGAGGAFGARGQAGGAGVRPAATGTVESVEGTVVTIKTQEGSVKVKVPETATIRKTISVGIADLKAGDNLTVMGQQESDGSITASALQLVPAQP